MGLETDITDIQSLNQNWPPVSDPRAQGADHIRNIKKAIQLTFPNLKQCLLNDAQFTALGTLIGDGSGTFTINGKLTVSDTLLVPTVTDWTTQQAVGAKDAEGRYLKPGDADGRYLKPGDADGRYVSSTVGGGDAGNIQQITLNNVSNQISAQTRDGVWHFAQPAGDYATNPALNTEITNRASADTNLQNQINNRVLKTGDTMAGSLNINTSSGGIIVSGNGGGDNAPGGVAYSVGLKSSPYVGAVPAALYRYINIYGEGPFATIWLTDGDGRGHELRFGADDRLRTASGNVFALTSELPRTFISAQQAVQTDYKYVIPHNLGRVPDAFWVYLVNVSSDWGYNPGQTAIPSFDDKSNGGFGPLPVSADRWNIFLPMSDAVPLVSRMDPSNGDNTLGDRQAISADRWRFVFYAVCMGG